VNQKSITIHPLETYSEMSICIDLQRRVWGSAELEIVPESIFVVAAHTGGQVLAAFDAETPVGFTLALPAFRGELRYFHSHMLAVLPDYQNQGVGRQLKLAQRDDALARGIDLIEWTFDPLQVKNAHFNLARLGAVVRRYLPDVYGRTTSPLHAGLPTDRLVAEWWLRSSRVRGRLNGKPHDEMADCERIALPANIRELCRSHPEEAEQIQRQVRSNFEKSFARGYTAVGFELDQEQGMYLMGVL
jgi:predicted GNAT superfamily acetyltransferase